MTVSVETSSFIYTQVNDRDDVPAVIGLFLCTSSTLDLFTAYSKFTENQAHSIAVTAQNFSTQVAIEISKCLFTSNRGDSIVIEIQDSWKDPNINLILNIEGTSFEANDGQAVGVSIHSPMTDFLATFKNCTFSHNSRTAIDIASFISGTQFYSVLNSSSILFDNITFDSNIIVSDNPAIVEVKRINNVTLNSCKFLFNLGTPIRLYLSTITVSGHSEVSNNLAYQGAGFSLIYSDLRLSNHMSLLIANNAATDVGGAIYIEPIPFEQPGIPPCFYRVEDSSFLDLDINITLVGNSATNGGNDIYGSALKSNCTVAQNASATSKLVFPDIFHFQSPGLSRISSKPKRVCLCNEDGDPQCANASFIFFTEQPRFPRGDLPPIRCSCRR